MRSAIHSIAVALLLVTGGCTGGFGDGPDTAIGPSADATGTRTTDRTGGGTLTANDRFPPGLTPDGLADPALLVSAHADVLEGQSVTLHERQVRRYGGGDRDWRRNRTLRTAANRTRFLRVLVTEGRPIAGASEGRGATFADGSRVYRKVRTPSSSWTDVLRTAGGSPEQPRNVRLATARTDDLTVVLNAFALADSATVRRSTADPGRYLVESSTVAHPDLLASHLNVAEIRNASLTAVVTTEGLVKRYRLEFVGTKRGRTVRGTTALEYSAVGETEVEAPAWYDEVKKRIGGSNPRSGRLRPRESSRPRSNAPQSGTSARPSAGSGCGPTGSERWR